METGMYHQVPHGNYATGQAEMPEQPMSGATGNEGREMQALRLARDLFRQQPDWVTFFREILGVDGAVRKIFPSAGEVLRFEQTPEYHEIQQMVAKLREKSREPADEREPTRVITVRLPKSLHESLRSEAHDRKTSMNKLCISKLLQMVDGELVPSD